VIDFSVPPEWLDYADQLDEIAAVIQRYLERDPLWKQDSTAGLEKGREQEFAGLPFKEPVSTALVHPTMALGQAVDHLTALAAVVRTERTALAMHTLIRPILVASGTASYVLGAPDLGERMRRVMNIELDSATEMMHLLQDRYPKQFARYDQRRRDIATAARRLWKHIATPEGKGGQVRDWYVGNKPPGDMAFVREALAHVQAEEIADTLYRLMSASTHAQPHALLTFIGGQEAAHHPLGYAAAPIRISEKDLLTWLLAPTTALWGAIEKCIRLYGWDPEPWQTTAIPRMVAWNDSLNRLTRKEFIDRTGLWLPPR
jgi:hypothetical protein